MLRIVAALLLALLGLGLAAFSISRFGALGAGAPLWLQAVASGELLLGQLVFGAGYAAWDEFGRAWCRRCWPACVWVLPLESGHAAGCGCSLTRRIPSPIMWMRSGSGARDQGLRRFTVGSGAG
ncbi:hypothetical protein [Deinococcus radiophilus]|uniref:hypothetical protein n=1 Tax=Deinococcus radiophilus TaxID=32062 RepID=UPI00361DCD9B